MLRIVAVCASVSAQEIEVTFDRLTIDDGLSNNNPTSIIQDKTGFIWIGTEEGLNKYDGYSIKIYKNKISDSKSLVHNEVVSQYIDSKGNQWVGTNGGLSLYNASQDNFVNFHFKPYSDKDVSHKRIRGFFEDSKGNFFVAVEYGWVYRYDTVHQDLKLFDSTSYRNINTVKIDHHDILEVGTFEGLILKDLTKNRAESLLKNKSVDVLLDDHDLLWLGVEGGGIYQYHKKLKTLRPYVSSNTRENDIQGLWKDSNNNIWITGGALRLFDSEEDKFYNVNDNSQSLTSLETNAIFEDIQENIWIGVYYSGVRIIRKTKRFNTIKYDAASSRGLSHSVVSSISMDENNQLLVGYFEGGIDIFNLKNKTKSIIRAGTLPGQLGEATVFFIRPDSLGNIWTGTYKGGLQHYNKKTRSFASYRHNPVDSLTIASNDVRSLVDDGKGNFWVVAHGKGLDRFDKKRKTFHHHKATSDGNFILDNWGYQLLLDSDHSIWYAATSGLFKFSGANYDQLNLYNNDFKNINSLSDNEVNCLYEDSAHKFWVGTINGLNLFDKQKNHFIRLTMDDGLPNNVINAICEDNNGKLWISTNKGICSLDRKTDSNAFSIKSYDKSDGLLDDQFYPRASFVDRKTGQIYFGGISGITWFHPDSIKSNTLQPHVVFTDFRLYYQSVPIGTNKSPLQKHISETKEIALPYNQKIITFDFIALNFVGTKKNQYAYRMEGFDDEWHYVGNNHQATYTNLDPGRYIFKVKASNNDGLWSEQNAEIVLVINPPFWRTYWAYVIYSLLVFSGIVLFRRSVIAKEKQRNELIREREAARRVYDENRRRIDFFTKISHELRTPLTLIVDPVHQLYDKYKYDAESSRLFSVMQRNVDRLLRIVNQLLDYRKIETGFMRLELSEGDIIKFVKDQAGDVSFKATQKKINFTIHQFPESYVAWFDHDKVEKIISNLLSNSLKYTPESGSVSLTTEVIDQNEDPNLPLLKLVIKDSGLGISKEDQKKIFSMFYRVDHRFSKIKAGGTGIGLALTKELVTLHGGTITLESEVDKGSSFIVILPLYLKSSEDAQPKTDLVKKSWQGDDLEGFIESVEDVQSHEETTTILVIEDNEEIRNYLSNELIKSYKIIEAFDGRDGLEKAMDIIPDLIICDIMMPEMDGLEMTGILKNDVRTSHIPIIMLTARSADDQKIEGYEIGADAYITKPFSTRLLKASVKNLLLSRKKLRTLFQQNLVADSKPEEVFENKVDQDFIRKINEAIENNISNQNLNTSQFAKEVGMSRAQLYKKFKAVTDQTIYEYILKIRLEKAKHMLEDTNLTVQEISFAVGFSKQSNFSRAFANQYGMPPSKIRKKP